MEELIELVKRMRAAQKKYFKNKTLADLEAAKNLERDVDHKIEELTVGVDLFTTTLNTVELKAGDYVTYNDRRCKIYKVEDSRLLLSICCGTKKWVRVEDCQR